ncbi:hypothetical protein [Catenuloplanes japonicus]|uniref:hypothetical protein n=1 Tax=Catenuloplanes japonicus TaxID=33876 RepID=UPI0012FCADD5|nr:hypothetical protein [Catenuloplanes japonicus]
MRSATSRGVLAMAGVLAMLSLFRSVIGVDWDRAETWWPVPEPERSFNCSIISTESYPSAAGEGAVCGNRLIGYDFTPVTGDPDGLSGVAAVTTECVAGPVPGGPRQATVIFAARYDTPDGRPYDASFTWVAAVPGLTGYWGSGVSQISASGLPVGVRSQEAFIEGESVQWQVRPTRYWESDLAWSQWFRHTVRC